MTPDIRTRLVYGLRLMAQAVDIFRDTHGNLSLREGDTVAIKPSGVPYGTIVEDDIYVCNIRGSHGGGKLRPSVDLPHHLDIYQNNPWVRSICHTHSPYATSFALAGQDIECVSTEQADYFGADVRCTGYRDLNSWGRELELDPSERAVLLEKHGCLTFGQTCQHAVELAVALENVAEKTFLARQLTFTRWVRSLPQEEIGKWHRRYQESYGQPKN